MTTEKKRLRWKREPRQTGLSAICAPPRGWEYHDGETRYATVSALGRGSLAYQWYWVAGWGSVKVPHKNTCNEPCDNPEEAKHQAAKYVNDHLKICHS